MNFQRLNIVSNSKIDDLEIKSIGLKTASRRKGFRPSWLAICCRRILF